jgi:hypothetical protein
MTGGRPVCPVRMSLTLALTGGFTIAPRLRLRLRPNSLPVRPRAPAWRATRRRSLLVTAATSVPSAVRIHSRVVACGQQVRLHGGGRFAACCSDGRGLSAHVCRTLWLVRCGSQKKEATGVFSSKSLTAPPLQSPRMRSWGLLAALAAAVACSSWTDHGTTRPLTASVTYGHFTNQLPSPAVEAAACAEICYTTDLTGFGPGGTAGCSCTGSGATRTGSGSCSCGQCYEETNGAVIGYAINSDGTCTYGTDCGDCTYSSDSSSSTSTASSSSASSTTSTTSTTSSTAGSASSATTTTGRDTTGLTRARGCISLFLLILTESLLFLMRVCYDGPSVGIGVRCCSPHSVVMLCRAAVLALGGVY